MFKWREKTVEVRGIQAIYYYIEHPGSVGIVARQGSQVLLVRQLRPAVGEQVWEIPAGTLEKGENPKECARRELEEEAGFVASNWRKLGELYLAPGYSTERMHVFEAKDLLKTSQRFDDTEEITEVKWFDLNHLFAGGAAQIGQPNQAALDAKTLAALFLAGGGTPASSEGV